MKIIFNSLIPIGKNFAAINLLGILFVKRGVSLSPSLINHEKIHSAQIRELGYVFFYIIYLFEWFVRTVSNGFLPLKAYRDISFEKEAYACQNNLGYLESRRHYSMWLK